MNNRAVTIIGISTGKPTPTSVGSVGVTGIYKMPVGKPVRFNFGGVEGDAVCDSSCHGGPDQAVYVYTQEDYRAWELSLGYLPGPGTFGENLTIAGCSSRDIAIGDRLAFDDVVLEVTCPRIPCSTFAEKMEDPTFVKRFRNESRPGFYCRVLQEGLLEAGDTGILKDETGPERVQILELFEDYYLRQADIEKLKRFLRAPIAVRTRAKLEARLDEVENPQLAAGRK